MKPRGQVAVHLALLMSTLLGVCALVVDLSMTRLAQQQLGNAAEAAAHAGAAQLNGTQAGMDAAVAMAITVAADNPVAGDAYTLTDQDVVLGYWNGSAVVPETDPLLVTTVQVAARRADLTAVFSRLAFSKTELAAGDYANAQAGGPGSSDCPMPIAIADCELAAVQAGVCGMDLVLNSARLDNGAWGRIGTAQPNAQYIRAALDPNTCAAASSVGDHASLNNGQVASGLSALAAAVSASPDLWDTAEWGAQPRRLPRSAIAPTSYGHVYYGQVIVFHDPGNCSTIQYNGQKELVGFATAVIYDVVTTTNAKSIRMRINCDVAPERGGGAYFGTTVPPRFVR